MAAACPTKAVQETKEWKSLVKEYGKEKATRFWQQNNEIVPEVSKDDISIVKHKGATQEQALNKLATTQSEISKEKTTIVVPEKGHILSGIKAGELVEVYQTVSGDSIAERVTMAQDVIFRNNKTKEEADAINNLPENKIKASMGTKLHGVIEEIIEARKLGKTITRPSYLSAAQFSQLTKGVDELITNIQEVQNIIDPDASYALRNENVVWDKKKNKAGSIDLLAVFSDGSAAIYDFKFINFSTSKGKVEDFEDKLDMKEDSWTTQIGEYKNILKDSYGVNLIRQSRIIPINIQYKWKKEGAKMVMSDTIKNLEMVGKEYTQPIPVANELTEDKKLNSLLSDLMTLRERLNVGMKSSSNVEAMRAKIRRVKDSIKSLQRKKDLNYLVNEISAINKEVNSYIHINNPEDNMYITDGDLRSFKEYLKVYHDFLENSVDTIRKAKETSPELYEDFDERLSRAMTGAIAVTGVIKDKLKERASEEAYFRGVHDLTALQRETGNIANYTKYLSDWQHPVFKTFKKMADGVIDDTRRDFNTVEEELSKLTKNLEEWGKSKGKSGLEIFDPLINEKTGDLVAEFTSEFWELRNKAKSSQDIKWFKDNFEVTEQDKKDYKESLEKQKVFVEKFYFNKPPEWRAKALERWIKKYDASNYEEAWFNPYAKISLKDKSKWQSTEYKNIQREPALKAYYDYYTKMNEEFHSFLPKSARIKKNFVANIAKDVVDMFAENKSVLKGIPASMLQSLEVREDDTHMGMINKLTGEKEYRIPILYTKPLRDHNGAIDINLKSKDLSRSLALFAKTAYNYKHASAIEDQTITLKQVLAAQRQILTNRYGTAKTDKITGEIFEGTGNTNTLDSFDKYVNFYLYGQSTQSDDKAWELNGKSYSGTKILQMVKAGYSLKTLGFNPVSAGAAYLGATANMHMVAHKGQFYDKKQLREAHRLNILKDEKASAFFKYFETEQDDLTYRKANDLSVSKVSKKLTMDTAFSWLQKGDAAVDFNITIAMMQNYGIDPKSGKVRRLSRIKDTVPSLWDKAEIKNDKAHIEGLTEAQYNQFRRAVRYIASTIKGQYSKEDLFMANTHIMGQSLMMFRNWMPRLVAERGRKARYNEDIEEVELGRMRVFFGEMLVGGVMPKIKNLLGLIAEMGTFSAYKHKLTEGQTSRYFDEFLADNPELNKKIENGEMTREELFEMYQESRIAQFRAFAVELRMYLLISGALMAAGTDWDDDGEKLYEEIPGGAQFLKVVDRVALELGFAFSPEDAKQLFRNPIPLTGLLLDTYSLIENSLDETRDIFAGDDYKGVLNWELDPHDKSPKFKYTSRFIPFWNPMSKFFDYFDQMAKED